MELSEPVCLHVWRRRQLLLKDSHEEVKLTEGTAMAAAQSRLVLDDIADILQLLVTQFALMEPLFSCDVHPNRRRCSKDVSDQWQESLENQL